MKTILIFLIFISQIFPQTQNKIPWPSLADSPWPTLRGDMQATGRSEFVGPETLNVKWMGDYPLGIFHGPVIGYGDKLFFGTIALNSIEENYIYAVNPDSSLFWRYITNSSWPNELAPLLTKDSSIIFLSNTGELYVLDFYGNLKWKKYINNQFTDLSIDLNGNLYFTSKDTLKILDSDGSYLLQKYIKKIYGSITFSPNGQTIYFMTGKPQSLDTVYFNSANLQGIINWNLKFDDMNYGKPSIDNIGNIFCFASDTLSKSYLYSINKEGEIRWQYRIAFDLFSATTIDPFGNVIACGIDPNSNNFVIISLTNEGSLNWQYEVGQNEEPNSGLVSDAKGNIFFGATWGTYFQALDKNGKLLWKLSLNGYEYDTSPAIGSDGTLYIGLHKSTFFREHKDNLIAIGKTSVNVEDENIKVDEFFLSQNYPNPFNPSTSIKFSLPEGGITTIKVYDILGGEKATILDEYKPAGSYTATFDGKNLPSGIYIYTITSGSFKQSRKMLLMK
ncbi:MAG TPA: T9SS type A sorting domain-containing protein [Ignavibacteriaceae bacterium]|nr:T9SS type A sorting domain-containing protein [Ignavibacteriaceae bacterium]